jgi:hypothetical protein
MKILKTISFFLLIPLVSCDPYTGAFIANNSSEKSIIDIKYDRNNQTIKDYVKIHNGFENFVKFIQNYDGSDGKLIATDTSKYIATFALNQKDTLVIWGGIRQSNDFDEIDEVVVHSNKRQTKIKGEDFQDVFNKNQAFYIYTVK